MVNWNYEIKIEDMSDEQLEERIKSAMDYKIPHEIRSIPYIGQEYVVEAEVVKYSTEELVARCPVTGYPDFYSLCLEYIPSQRIPELKSLKFYLTDYNEIPISHEHLAVKIYADFLEAVNPLALRLELIVAIRGGITTTVVLGEIG